MLRFSFFRHWDILLDCLDFTVDIRIICRLFFLHFTVDIRIICQFRDVSLPSISMWPVISPGFSHVVYNETYPVKQTQLTYKLNTVFKVDKHSQRTNLILYSHQTNTINVQTQYCIHIKQTQSTYKLNTLFILDTHTQRTNSILYSH